MKYFIVIDGGTQNIKAFIFDERGNEVAAGIHPVSPYFSTQPDFAEQDAEHYLTITKEVTRNMIKDSGISAEDFITVAITSHRATIVPVDQDGNCIRPAITWLDERKIAVPSLASDTPSPGAKTEGMQAEPKEYQSRSKFAWIRKYEPENYEKTYKFLTISSHIFHALTGEFKDGSSMIVGLFPIDVSKFQWHSNEAVYEIFGVERERLPDLVGPTEIAGRVSKEGLEGFGVPEGLPVIIGAGDKQSELLGAGGVVDDIGEISYGTAAVIEVLSRKYVTHPKMEFFTWGAAIPQNWTFEGFVGRGYWMVSWFKQEFAQHIEEEAEKLGIKPEDLLNREMQKVPAGSMGLVLQPYWSPLIHDPLSKGAIIGFSGQHTRAHVYRAIIEGIAYELRRLKEEIEEHSGQTIKELRVGGGGSQSDEIMQITADVFNLPARRVHTANLAALGAAIDAAVALKIYDGFSEAIADMVRIRDTFAPQAENVQIYDRLFNEVYKEMFSRLLPLYHKIAEITGYPNVVG